MNTPPFPEELHLPDKDSYSKEEIDSIDVNYCKSCGSLKIMVYADDADTPYCDKCFSTDIGQCSIEEWEKQNKPINRMRNPKLIKNK